MIDSKDFVDIKKQFAEYEAKRDSIITKGRDLITLSKKVIYSVHRQDMASAHKAVEEIRKEKIALVKLTKAQSGLECEGSYRVAIQEYVEALAYYFFVKDAKLMTHKDLEVEGDLYILGLCDLTGELGRRAVYAATREDYDEVVQIKDAVAEIFGVLLEFDFRDNETRRKFDAVKYDLKKLEDLVLELKLKEKI